MHEAARLYLAYPDNFISGVAQS